MITESLEKVIEHLEEEARMILPGIQALFGFQLVAVFNQRFTELTPTDQTVHFIALLCSALSVMLVLTPAAFHRQTHPRQISEKLCRVGTVCLTASLLPLCVATALDVYVITTLLKYNPVTSVSVGVAVFSGLFYAWFLFPRLDT